MEVISNQLYCMDCMELFPQLPDGCVSLILTDPPLNRVLYFLLSSRCWFGKEYPKATYNSVWQKKHQIYHPTIKNAEFLSWLIQISSQPGELIFDGFRGMVEYPPSFLTEHDPLRIVGIAALQISNPANRTFFHHQAILYGKACLHQAVMK